MAFNFIEFFRSKEHQNLSGKLRPSGRFSVVQIFPKKSKKLKDVKAKVQPERNLRSLQQIDDAYATILSGEYSPVSEMSTADENSKGAVGLSDAAISPIRARRGSKGIGTRQRDILCWGANVLERIYGRSTLSFLTYTLPPLSDCDLKSVKAGWSDIVNRVQLRIKEKLNAQGVKTSIAGCVELQLERYEATGDIYPHLHLVFRGRRDSQSSWGLTPLEYRQIWRQCVSKFLCGTEYDWEASENVEPVRKSVSGYLAKYVSKCASKGGGDVLSQWHPTDWIFLSRRIRQLYEQMSRTGYAVAELLFAVVRGWRVGIGYVCRVCISSPAYGERCIGYTGWLKGEETYPSYADVHGGEYGY